MKFENRKTGLIGEEVALQHLLKKGLQLVLRNFSTRFGEIDLIMRDKSILVFVEVKAKKGLKWGSPEEMFTRGKYERVKRMASVYLQGQEVPCRIDMVAVVLNSQNELVSVKHYENVTGF
ncbi:MAG: YraN family protein [Patescibacteria group bacterium]